jgi:hypothetical protein
MTYEGLGGTWNAPTTGRGRRMTPLPRESGMSRTRFELRERASLLSVDVDHDTQRVVLFRDGVEVASGEMPVRFAVQAGNVEVSGSMYGMRRVHLIGHDGAHTRLTPAAGSPDHRRAAFGRRHPRLSRAVGVAAVGVLPLAAAAPSSALPVL